MGRPRKTVDPKRVIELASGSVMDVTERKPAQAALRNRERELQQLFDVVPHSIIVLGLDGSPIYANEVLLNYFGCAPEDIHASDFRARVYHRDDFDRVQAVREDAISRGVPWETEARLRRKDGQYRWFLILANPLCDDELSLIMRRTHTSCMMSEEPFLTRIGRHARASATSAKSSSGCVPLILTAVRVHRLPR